MKIIKCIFLLFWAVQVNVFSQSACDAIDAALLRIDKLVVDGKLEQALTALKKIKNDPNVRNCEQMKVVEYKIKDIESKMPQSSMTPQQMYDLGADYYYGTNGKAKDYAEAVKWLRKAAEQGNASGQSFLGYMYQYGYGVSQDYAEAVKWYRKSAEQGNASGQNNLGYMYEKGYGVSKDYTEALKWYRKSAEQGDAYGQSNLGYMYRNGYGVSQDYAEAVKWYRKSAEQGYASGQSNLGHMYENGLGVTKNLTEARKWYEKAAAQGDDYAKGRLKVLNGN